jgi:hypothetical protein
MSRFSRDHGIRESELNYDVGTPSFMIELLEKLRRERTRVRLHWGDMETGEDWMEDHDIEGRVSATTGVKAIPILVHNNRSLGGTPILTHSIVKIEATRGKEVLYQHPLYHTKQYEVGGEEAVVGGFLESLQVQEVH